MRVFLKIAKIGDDGVLTSKVKIVLKAEKMGRTVLDEVRTIMMET